MHLSDTTKARSGRTYLGLHVAEMAGRDVSLHVQDDRHGPVVHDLYSHPRSEYARLDRNAECREGSAERLVESFRDGSRRRTGEVGASSPLTFAIGDKRELAHDEGRAARVEEAAVELARIVLEDPEAGHAARQALGVARLVAPSDTEQQAETRPDLPHDLAGDDDAGLEDALDDRAQLLERAEALRVVLAARAERFRELQVAAGLRPAPELLERAGEAVVRVVVRR